MSFAFPHAAIRVESAARLLEWSLKKVTSRRAVAVDSKFERTTLVVKQKMFSLGFLSDL